MAQWQDKFPQPAKTQVQTLIDQDKGEVQRLLNEEEAKKRNDQNQIEAQKSYAKLVSMYPQEASKIRSMIKEGVHDPGIIAKTARYQHEKKIKGIAPRSTWEKVFDTYKRTDQQLSVDMRAGEYVVYGFLNDNNGEVLEALLSASDEIDFINQQDPIQADGLVEDLIIKTSNILPSIVMSAEEALPGAAAGGTAALLAGSLGPQALTFEEIVTLPAGMAMGGAASTTHAWILQGTGSIFLESVRAGVDPNNAKLIATLGGAVYGMIEKISVSKLIPKGFNDKLKDIVTGSLSTSLSKVLKGGVINYGEQNVQEVAQEAVLIASEEINKNIDNAVRGGSIEQASAQEIKDRLWQTLEATAKGMIIPVGVSTTVTGVQTAKEVKKQQAPKEEAIKQREAQAKAIDEVNAAEEAGETTAGTAALTRYLLEQDPEFDSRSSLEISNEVVDLTDDFIKNELKQDPEEFFEQEGITREETEEYYATGSTQVNFQKGTGRTAIKLYKGHDADTVVEEFYHDYFEFLGEEDKAAFEKYHNESGDTRSLEEHFGQEGRDFFFSEKLHEKAGGVRKLFEQARQTLKDLIKRIRKIRGANIPQKIQDLYTQAGTRDFSKAVPLKPKEKKLLQARKMKLRLNEKPKSKEFKSWFKDSKVVDEKGEPMVMYHGTNETFEYFRNPPAMNKKGETVKDGVYFVNDPLVANTYANQFTKSNEFPTGAQVYPVYLNIKNPYKAKEGEDTWGKVEELEKQGYDGVVTELTNMSGPTGVKVYKAFSPFQIKGKFNEKPGKSGKIMFQARKVSDLQLQNIPIKKKNNIRELAAHLSERAQQVSQETGVDLTQDTEEALNIISDVIAEEIKAEVKNEKNAIGWYSKKMDKALNNLATIYPSIKKNPIDNQVFKIGLAVTSNGTAVQDNLAFSLDVYEYWLKNNKLPTNFVKAGKTAPAMNKAFKLYNGIVEEHGVEAVHEFINAEFTVGELKRMGYSVTGELVGAKVRGAAIFGPKVGGGFLSNLNGHYEYVTMDRWFMRTMGRIRGNLTPDQDFTKQFRNFKNLLRRSPSVMKKYDLSIEDLNNDDKVIAISKKVYNAFSQGGFKKKTKLNNASRALIKRVEYINEAPTSGKVRETNRKIMDMAVAKTGIKDMTMADAQAIIWFPEKRLYSKFGVGSQRGKKETNYEIESKEFIKNRATKLDRRDESFQAKPSTEASKSSTQVDGTQEAKKPTQKITFQARKKAKTTLTLELDPESYRDIVQRKIQDKMNRLGHVVKKAKEVRKISDEDDAALAAELYIGKAREQMDKFEKAIFSEEGSLLDRILKSGYSLKDFGNYLHARHAQERNAHIASIREDMLDGGSGMTNAEAKAILKKHKGDKKIQALAKEFYNKVTKKALKARLDAGLITNETYETLTNYYKNYVPLFVVADDETRSATGKGFSIAQGAEIKRAKGSEKERINPIYSGIFEMLNVIRKAEKNKVGQKFLKLAEEFESSAWEVEKQKYTPVFGKDGEIQYMNPQFKLADNVFAVRRDGKLLLITIKDEALARGLKNLGAEKVNKYLVKANGFVRSIVTTYNPEFIITNFARDIQTALIHVIGEHKGIAKQVLINTPKAIRGVFRNVRGKDNDYWSERYEELKASGGKVGWFDMDSLQEHQEKVEKALDQVQKGKGSARKAARFLGEFVNNVNESVESGVRLATYDALIKKGMTKGRAAQVAKNITVNFNKKGEWGTTVNSLYMFANATVQGTARIAISLSKSKKTRAIVGSITGMSAGLSLVNYMVAPEEWEKKSEWEKDNYLIFMLPNGDDVRIRVPYGYNIFHTAGQVTGDVIQEAYVKGHGFKNVRYMDKAVRVLSSINNAVSPLGDGSVSQMITPTLLDPIVQLGENKKFTGSPIFPDKMHYKKKGARYKNYWDSNPPTWVSRAVTEGLSNITGGETYKGIKTDKDGNPQDHYVPGWVDLNPEALDHIGGFLTGGMGKFISRSVNTGINFAVGRPTPSRDIPFIRQFYGEPDKRGFTEKRLIRKMLDNSEIEVYNHVEVARFKRYVHDAIKLGVLSETDAKLVKDENGDMIPWVIRDFINSQRLAIGIKKESYKKKKKGKVTF